jgi:hypothetical protein
LKLLKGKRLVSVLIDNWLISWIFEEVSWKCRVDHLYLPISYLCFFLKPVHLVI